MSKRILTILLVGVLPAIASCATMSNRPEATGPVTLKVTDTNSMDVDVYVLSDGFSTRMGTVSTAQTSSFEVPDQAWQSVSGLRVIIDPIGSRTGFISERINGVQPGSTINFEVAPDLPLTWYNVRLAAANPASAGSSVPQPR